MITLDDVKAELQRAGINLDGLDVETNEQDVDNGPFRLDGPIYQKMESIINANWDAGTGGLFKGKGDEIVCNIKLNAIQALRLVQFVAVSSDDILPDSYEQVEQVMLAILDGVSNGMAAYQIKAGG